MEHYIEQAKSLKIPQHVAIMLDGNRRYAKEKFLPQLEGHRRGGLAFEKLTDFCRAIGVKCITGWAFSTENWKRTEEEVSYIFDLARSLSGKYMEKCLNNQIRFRHIGRRDRLPSDLVEKILEMEEKTKEFSDFTLCLALDYGGRDEVVRAVDKLVNQKLPITEESMSQCMDTYGLPDVDLIIRTGGEIRLSGFMLWQSAYAELYFTPTKLPAFDEAEMIKALKDYTSRDRRFGGDSKKSS